MEFFRAVRERAEREQMSQQSTSSSGGSTTSSWKPTPPSIIKLFQDYVFKDGATHGKDLIYKALGFDSSSSSSHSLATDIFRQATSRFESNDFVNGVRDMYGQRINIPIDLTGPSGQSSSFFTGWMIRPDGSISLSSPYTGPR
jgi:filamentous hemagglutinin